MRPSFSIFLRSTFSAFLLIALAAGATADDNIWVSHGPNDVGWINDLAIADSVAYAATSNGVFLSHDRGVTWRQSGLEGEPIRQIVAREGAPVVLAIPDRLAPHISRDRGASWAAVSGIPSYVRTAGIDPDQPSIIYAGDGQTIFKSTDAGVSWQTMAAPGDPPSPEAFAFNSGATYVLSYSRLYKSVDGASSWQSVQPPLDTVEAIAAGAADGVVYAAGWGAGGGSFCRSADSAATWTCSGSPAGDRILEIPGQTAASPRILASSTTSNTNSAGTTVTRKTFLSRDGGATWALVTGGLEGPVQAFASEAAGSFVLAGTDQQVFRSEDRGDTWTPFRAGLKAIKIGALAIDPQHPSTIWTGGTGLYSSGPGLFRSTDAGLSWSPAGGPQGPKGVDALLIDPTDPRKMYAGWDRVFRTEDGGETWTSAYPNTAAKLTSLALDPADASRVWAGIGPGHVGRTSPSGPYEETGAGLFPSDEARSWGPPQIARSIYCLLFDERRPGTIYAGSYDDLALSYGYYGSMTQKGGSIFISYDNGATFTKPDIDFGDHVRSIATDAFEDGVLYLSTRSRGLFRSNDAGATWERTGGSTTEYRIYDQILADPVRPGRLYASGYPGFFRSDNGGRTWQSFSEGLPPNISTGPLVITPDGRWLYVGTNAAGVFQRDLENETAAPSFPCAPSATRLCLVGNRYAVDLVASHRSVNGPGAARPLGDRAGYFGLPFATGDPDLPEVVVKMLADGTFGPGGAPIFFSSLTSLPFVLTVTDTVTGRAETYPSNPDAPFCGGTDLVFGEMQGSMSPRRETVAAEGALHLLGGRFSVTLEARHPRDGRIATGLVMSSADRFGFFSLPDVTGNPQFPEVFVKMVDARWLAGKFWFFHTGLTSLEYTLTVTDTVTGTVQTYQSATPFCGAADTHTFEDSPSLDLSGEWTGRLTFGTDFHHQVSCASSFIGRVVLQHEVFPGTEVTGSFQANCVPGVRNIYIRGDLGSTKTNGAYPLTVYLEKTPWVSLAFLARLTGSASSTAIELSGEGGTKLSLSR